MNGNMSVQIDHPTTLKQPSMDRVLRQKHARRDDVDGMRKWPDPYMSDHRSDVMSSSTRSKTTPATDSSKVASLCYTIVRFIVPLKNTWYHSVEYASHDFVTRLIELCTKHNPSIAVGHPSYPMVIHWSDIRVHVTDQVPIEELITYRQHLSSINIFLHAFTASLHALEMLMSDARLLVECIDQFHESHPQTCSSDTLHAQAPSSPAQLDHEVMMDVER